jgi:hypothetical protein
MVQTSIFGDFPLIDNIPIKIKIPEDGTGNDDAQGK